MKANQVGFALGLFGVLSAATANAQNVFDDDLVVRMQPGSLATVTIDGVSTLATVKDGKVAMRMDGDSACASQPTLGCPAAINVIAFTLEDLLDNELVVGETPIFFDLRDPAVAATGVRPTTHNGVGFPLPDLGTTASANFFSAEEEFGPEVLSEGVMAPGVAINYQTLPEQAFTIDGTFPISFEVFGNTITGTVTLMANAVTPFENAPPIAVAGPDQSVCGGSVTLNASGSFDQEGPIVTYRWLSSTGVLLASTPIAQVTLPAGVSTITLEVIDASGAVGTDSLVVTVEDNVPPHFVFVPPDVTAPQCGSVQIGQAQATGGCGSVTVTNNAPSFFFAGITTVTWTARSSSGLTTTATQRVFVELGNDSACCPPGTRILRGTSNNNTLTGTSGRDCILGLGGQDVINGLGGDDLISGGDGDDIVRGGAGNDLVNGGTGQDQVFGEANDDYVGGGDGDDRLEGGTGNDVLNGGQGQDRLFGGSGNDRCLGGTGDDQLFGEDGDDLLDGQENNNVCTGGPGIDTMLRCTPQDTPELLCSGEC